jgi:hypothetical protein
VEASRKHGSFDMRWSSAHNEGSRPLQTALALSAADAAEALDWGAFCNRYFRERRRHDSEARSAYAAYKQGREWAIPPARLSLVPTERVPAPDEQEREEAGTRRLMAAMAAAHHKRPKQLASVNRRNRGGTDGQR